jgi:hypothetical protein
VKREVEPPHNFPNFQGVIFAAIEMREAHLLFWFECDRENSFLRSFSIVFQLRPCPKMLSAAVPAR